MAYLALQTLTSIALNSLNTEKVCTFNILKNKSMVDFVFTYFHESQTIIHNGQGLLHSELAR